MQKYVKVYETMDEFYAWQNAQTPYYVSTVEPAIAAVDSPTEEEAEEDEVSIEMAKTRQDDMADLTTNPTVVNPSRMKVK